jgi:hypothetical protein
MRKIGLLGLLFTFSIISKSQSKVFKEVSEDVSSEMKLIMQDNALVGYLLFSQLEKASTDSFNYRITLMDENLNEIGTVNFRQEHLNLEAVSFEQDVLCLVYLKSNIIGKEFKNGNEYNNFDVKNEVFSQFITLDGKIVKTNAEKISLSFPGYDYYGSYKKKFTVGEGFIQGIQLKNIPGSGYACFYKDKFGQKLINYDVQGNKKWDKSLSEGSSFNLLTTDSSVFILQRSIGTYSFRNYYLQCFNARSGEENYEINLNDGNSNPLNVLNIDIDPSTGIPYLSGNIVNQNQKTIYTNNQLARNPYIGVFTMDLRGAAKDSIQKKFTYWNTGAQEPVMTAKGFIPQTKSYLFMTNSFRDYNNNTYFVGTELVKKPKFLAALITAAIVIPLAITPPTSNLSYLLYVPTVGLISGTKRWRSANTTLLKLTPKGKLSFETSLPAEHSKMVGGGKSPQRILGNRLIYNIDNPETKNNYIISTDKKKIVIYNIKSKKTARTIPLKAGNIRTFVFPAKEGHIMVFERNSKEKYTRLSIEALN